ncbi:MAG: hypothetical protein V1911_01650 [Candidatus Micrarchaeota archaeon]
MPRKGQVSRVVTEREARVVYVPDYLRESEAMDKLGEAKNLDRSEMKKIRVLLAVILQEKTGREAGIYSKPNVVRVLFVLKERGLVDKARKMGLLKSISPHSETWLRQINQGIIQQKPPSEPEEIGGRGNVKMTKLPRRIQGHDPLLTRGIPPEKQKENMDRQRRKYAPLIR